MSSKIAKMDTEIVTKIGKRSFLSDENTFAAQLNYVNGIEEFDLFIKNKSQDKTKFSVNLSQYPKGLLIKLYDRSNSVCYGLAYHNIKEFQILTDIEISEFIITTEVNTIDFTLTSSSILDLEGFLKALKLNYKPIISAKSDITNLDASESGLLDSPMKENFFSTKGRIGRDQFFFRSILLSLPWLFVYFKVFKDPTVFMVLILLPAYIFNLIQKVKRLHDFDVNGIHSIWTIIPIVNIISWFILIYLKGTEGPNRYGPQPVKTDLYES